MRYATYIENAVTMLCRYIDIRSSHLSLERRPFQLYRNALFSLPWRYNRESAEYMLWYFATAYVRLIKGSLFASTVMPKAIQCKKHTILFGASKHFVWLCCEAVR